MKAFISFNIKVTVVFLFTLLTLSLSAENNTLNADSLIQPRFVTENYGLKIVGRVVNSTTKQGFAGVRISVINTKITAMTSEDGSFEIRVPSKDVMFSVDAPGFLSQEVALKGRDSLNIQLFEKNGMQTSFYNESILSANKVSSISEFSPSILSVDEDITSRLNGEVHAMTHSGAIAGGSAIFMRGFNSLNVNAQPLFIVDGSIWQMQDDIATTSIHSGFFGNPLSLISPDDLEKVTVLKNGTALYGSKGANGVVIIETKRAHDVSTEISANISFGYKTPIKSMPVMNAGEYRLYVSDILSGMYDNTTLIEKYKFLDDDESKSYYKANHNNTDWLDLINEGGLVQNYSLGVKGGDETALYAFSVGYSKADGNIDNTNFNRLNARFNSDINLTKKLKLAVNIAFAQTERDIFNDGIDELSSPYYLSLIKSPLYSPYIYENTTGILSNKLSDVDELGVGNPLSLLKYGEGIAKRYRFNIGANPTYQITDQLKASLSFVYSWDKLNEDSYRPDEGMPNIPLLNEFGEMYAVSRNFKREVMSRQNSVSWDANLNWSILKNTEHNVDLLGGYRYLLDSYNSSYREGHNSTGKNIATVSPELRYTTGLDDNWKSMSWYAKADYSLKNRYLLTGIASMDASSRFGKEADGALKLGGLAWGVFPSISGGWIISSEEFMQNVDFVNFLKLNAGYGMAGNDNILNYATRSYFSSVQFMGKAFGLVLDNIGNEKLKWETTGTAHMGVDFSMFNNRWSVSSDFYMSKTKDLLTRKQLPEVAGLKYFWSNDGELENKGFEISTNVRVLDMRDMKLDFGASIGHYKNKVKSLANGSFTTDIYGGQIITTEGQAAGVFYGYKTKGVFSTPEAANEANLSIRSGSGALTSFGAGDMHFEDYFADNIIDEKDKQIIGDPNPDFYGNFNMKATYKNFSLTALFTYSYGNDAYNALRANLESGKDIFNQATSMQNRWVANGQNASIPRATYGDPMGNSRFSDRWIEDASYLKFKSLSLTYKLPINMTFLQEVSLWGSVENICTFTKYLGNDPEFSYGKSVLNQGVDAGFIPLTRSFNFGVKINL